MLWCPVHLALAVTVALCGVFAIAAAGPAAVTSAKVVLVEAGDAYVSAGYPFNEQRFHAVLHALWQATPSDRDGADDQGRALRPVGLDAVEAIVGPIDRSYVVVRRRMTVCPLKSACRPAVAGIDIVRMRVEAAMLAQWGCDRSTIPVVRLGKWPWPADGPYPEAVAVGAPPGDGWRVEQLGRRDIPAALRSLVPAEGDVARVTARDGGLSFFLLYRPTEVHDVYTVVPSPVSTPPKLLDATWPIDGRC
jgi:hypothetical protein